MAPMPNPVDNNTQIPASRVAISEKDMPSRPWYRWFFNIYTSVEAGRRYGSFYDTTTHTAVAINTAYPITFNNTYPNNNTKMSYGVYLGTTTSQVFVNNTAIYNLQFSLQCASTAGSAKSIYVWPRVNGVDIVQSAIQALIVNGTTTVVTSSFMLSLNKGDYFELIWSTNDTGITLAPQAAASPVPAIPSVILTVTSNIGA